jgi:hypothetical protein
LLSIKQRLLQIPYQLGMEEAHWDYLIECWDRAKKTKQTTAKVFFFFSFQDEVATQTLIIEAFHIIISHFSRYAIKR